MNVGPQDISSKKLNDAVAEIVNLGSENPGLAMFLCRLSSGTSCDGEIRLFAKHYPGLKWHAYLSWSGFPDALISGILGGQNG